MHQVFISLHCTILLPDVDIFTLHDIPQHLQCDITLQQNWRLYCKMMMKMKMKISLQTENQDWWSYDDDVGKQLEPECAAELKEVRRGLLEDYRISPAVQRSCEDDVKTHCHSAERRNVVHCLMDVARRQYRAATAAERDSDSARARLGEECYNEVCDLLLTVTLCVCFKGSVSRWTWVSRYQNGDLSFIGAKDDGDGDDSWSYKTCKALVKSSP